MFYIFLNFHFLFLFLKRFLLNMKVLYLFKKINFKLNSQYLNLYYAKFKAKYFIKSNL